MRFLAELHQSGGCDYTIGCGVKLVWLKARDLASAEKESVQLFEEYDDEQRLEKIILHGVEQSLHLDVAQGYRNKDEQKAKEANSLDKEARRRQYEKLKQEFGG